MKATLRRDRSVFDLRSTSASFALRSPHGALGHLLALFVSAMVLSGCAGSAETPSPFTAEDLRHADRSLLEVAMEDAFSPPVASRVYAYPHIAHYLALRAFHPAELEDLAGVLNDLAPLPALPVEGCNDQLTALLAFCHTARLVVFSEHMVDDLAEGFKLKAKNAGVSADHISASDRCAKQLVDHLKTWMNDDGYVYTRTLDRFTSDPRPGGWSETPPDYTAALEPHWAMIRTFILDSADAYQVPDMIPYSPVKGSEFWTMVMEVYDTKTTLNDSLRAIALYWDDNPTITTHRGHLTTQEHRIAPPGHWLNIITQVTRRDSADLFLTTTAYTLAAIAMFDGLISCWHEKFRTDVIRPITYINNLADPNWTSRIQTPPFPEYPSGHSVVSASAARVMDHVLGSDVPFLDSTEVVFGLGTRAFTSYQDAAWQVSLSRFYGGIHYMRSIEEGYQQGRTIGDRVSETILRSSKTPS